ncbi:hypothetical protein Agub_g3087 [Astrephomene gubernaculifera]|uniref:Mannose-P-dolichol utilization defect 1 protein n=1 Tax=Astrephomene gubernaculifera TaxID=47775 RepID=A0AAD3DK30_9CHLO|nr:hypothetical protein Agub_g3087 [Astrephomene gubernaculifera]
MPMSLQHPQLAPRSSVRGSAMPPALVKGYLGPVHRPCLHPRALRRALLPPVAAAAVPPYRRCSASSSTGGRAKPSQQVLSRQQSPLPAASTRPSAATAAAAAAVTATARDATPPATSTSLAAASRRRSLRPSSPLQTTGLCVPRNTTSTRKHPPTSSTVTSAAPAALTTAATAVSLPTCTTCATTATATTAASSSSLAGLLAVLLGYGCLVGSCFRSVPQIAAILRAGGSTEGLSLASNVVELACFTVTVAYNVQQGYAFNTYGEVFACWIQDLIIVGLIFRHMRLPGGLVAAACALFAGACAWLVGGACPAQLLSALQLSTVGVMVVGARLPQIVLNFRRGDAGVLAPATCALNVAGCLVRVFTTLVLTRDVIILGGCVTQLLLNAILLYQSIATPGKQLAAATAAAAPGSAAPAAAAVGPAAAAAAAVVAAADPPLGGTGAARLGGSGGVAGGGEGPTLLPA